MSTPSSNTRSARRARKKQPSRRGGVSSSNASSPCATDDEWVLPTTPVPVTASSASEMEDEDLGAHETTPKRKVIATLEGSKTQPKKREGLQARLQAAAKMKKSVSQGGGMVASASIGQLVPKVKPGSITTSASGSVHAATTSNDKVIVCVRVKPTESPFVETAYELSSDSLTLTDKHPNVQKRGGKAGREDEYTYNFDALLQFPSRTPDLYQQRVAPLINKAMNGYNSTIFAYGQTGSGKSFTMTGVEEELGIIPCAVDGVFDAITADPERAFLLRVSYIEIYNETLRDLLNFKKGPLKDDEKPNIHFNKGKVYVDPLVEEIVSTPQDIVDLLERGNTQRKTGATDWNERSSRSHSVFTIVIESKPRDGDGDDDVRLSRLTLIDLAGSEKAVSDLERRGEGKHINRSLLALKNVINKLTDKKSGHIPYRDSKLTHLLENALGGDSNICVICTLSGEEEHYAETLETLKFAGNCARVETKAKKNILMSSDRALIKAKDKEIEILKRRLEGLQKDGGAVSDVFSSTNEVQDLADSVAAMEARKYRLTTQLAKLNTQVLTSELPRSGSGVPLASPKPKRRRISDLHNAPGGSRVGLGSPKQKAFDNRRAVSSMLRMPQVPENEMPAIHAQLEGDTAKTFDHDRIVAALRRALASRDQDLSTKGSELDRAIAQVTQLQDELISLQAAAETSTTEHEAAMRDYHAKLESTRTELVATVDEKVEKIDSLEATVLDLRTSREELLLEGEIRVDELKAQLATVVQESTNLRNAQASERSVLEDQLVAVRSKAEAVPALQAQVDEATRERQAAVQALEDHQKASLAREADLSKSRKLLEQNASELEKLRVELSVRRGLEGDQARLEAMLVSEREGRRMAEKDNQTLVSQLAELREFREKAKAWEVEKGVMLEQLDAAKARDAAATAELSAAKETIVGLTARGEAHDRELKDANRQAREAKDQLHDQTSEVYRLQMELSTNTAETSNRINSLESQLLAEKDRAKSLEEVRVAFEEKRRQLDESAAEVDRLRSQIDSNTSSSSELGQRVVSLEEQLRIEAGSRKSSEEVRMALETEVVDLRATVEGHETEVSTLSRELDSARKSRDEVDRKLEAATTVHQSLTSELEGKTVELAALEKAKSEVETAAKATSTDIERLRREPDEVNHSHRVDKEDLERRLDTKGHELTSRQASLENAEKRLEAAHAEVSGKAQMVNDLQSRLDAEKKARSAAEDALKAASKGQDEVIRELQKQVEASTREHATATEALQQATATLQGEQSEHRVAQRTLATLGEAKSEVERQLSQSIETQRALDKTNAAALVDLERRCEAAEANLAKARAESKDLQSRLAAHSDDQARQIESSAKRVQDLEKRLADTVTQIGDLETRLSTEKAGRVKADSQIASLGNDHRAALTQAQNRFVVLQKRYDEQSGTLSTTRVELESRVAALKIAEEGSRVAAKDKVQIEKLVAEVAKQSASVKQLTEMLEKANADLALANTTIARLREELALAKKEAANAEAAIRPRNASTPTGGSVPLDDLRVHALKTASTGQGNLMRDRLRTTETEEIERLEKVIEEQVDIISKQREKIMFWAKELEQQHEVIRMLTQEGSTTPTRPSPLHGLPKSRSVADIENVSPRPSLGSSHAKVHLPSSFTAKNLALPTTPTPLPMHPSQFSNTTARKGRRITIDHDIDLLTESSKVNKAKAVFDSPEKEERAAIALTRKKTVRMAAFTPTGGSPIQRRP